MTNVFIFYRHNYKHNQMNPRDFRGKKDIFLVKAFHCLHSTITAKEIENIESRDSRVDCFHTIARTLAHTYTVHKHILVCIEGFSKNIYSWVSNCLLNKKATNL